MKLGEWVDRHKRGTGKRQGEIAREMGLSQPDLSAYCNEKRVPMLDRRQMIQAFTNGQVLATSAADWNLPEAEKGHFYQDPNDPQRVFYVPPKVKSE